MFMANIIGWKRQIRRRKQVVLKTHTSRVTCLDARKGNEVIIYCQAVPTISVTFYCVLCEN